MDGNHLHAEAATSQVAVDQLAFVGLRGKPIPIIGSHPEPASWPNGWSRTERSSSSVSREAASEVRPAKSLTPLASFLQELTNQCVRRRCGVALA
jgi:hypothetical protein